jgi:5-(carboxyamino)imidazole ribonucleotide mutase
MDNANNPKVAILMGSKSDWDVMQNCPATLEKFGVPCVCRVLSAHRTPTQTAEFIKQSEENGVEVIIAAAGMAAHLAGAVAANTTLPVIGVPMKGGALDGLDALLSTVQMPRGIPVATVAIGKAGAINAAILAVQILAVADPDLRGKLRADRVAQAHKILGEKLD